MSGITFLSPLRLWLLLGVVALGIVYLVLQMRRRAYAVRFTNIDLLDSVAPKRPGWRRHVTALAFLAALSSLVVGFAQPTHQTKVPRERATIIMAIDTSLSMEASDVSPSRFEAAKIAAKQFVDEIPTSLNLGLVSFDASAVVQVPPGKDNHAEVKAAIDRLQLHEGTAIGEAIVASLRAIETVPPDAKGTRPPARVVLMSDGATTVGIPNNEASQQAATAHVPVSTIAYGTPDATIVAPDGTEIPVPVDEAALKQIAQTTKGTAFTAASSSQLKKVYNDIGHSVGYVTTHKEITAWFAGVALAVFLLTAALSLAWFARLP
jgi:Ca-activated chloride channel family protein